MDIKMLTKPQNSNGISSLYSILPEVTPTDGVAVSQGYVLSGTHRKGPYGVDYSGLSAVNSFRNVMGYMFGIHGIFENANLTVIPQLKEMAPNISGVNFENLLSVNYAYGMCGFAQCNYNMLSVDMRSLRSCSGSYCMQRFAANSYVPCSLLELTSIVGDNSFQRAWSMVDATQSQQKESFFPKLKSARGNYAFSYAFYQYKPKSSDGEVNLSDAHVMSGNYICEHMFEGSHVKKVVIGNTAIYGERFGNYMFSSCPDLSCIEFPNLSNITSPNQGYHFAYAFANCQKLTYQSFPELVNISSGYHAFQCAWRNTHNIQRIDFPKLTAITTGGGAFSECITTDNNQSSNRKLVEFHFPKLKTLGWGGTNGYSPFRVMQSQANATRMHTWKIYFDEMTTLKGGNTSTNATFYGDRGLIDVYFPSLTSITTVYAFNNCNELTGFHFGASNEESIRASAGFTTLWGRGAGAATVYFDL